MRDPRTDAIAREAARLLETGRAPNIGDAIRAAAGALGFQDAGACQSAVGVLPVQKEHCG